MYRANRFARYFLGLGNKPSSLNTYQVVLKKADLAIGGLDEKLMSDGDDAVLRWARTTNADAQAVFEGFAINH